MNTESSYKPHIDGLRTIAVWLVVLFHINPVVFGGGYLGVDIFFVISGFVITKSLFKDYLTTSRIHIFQFYVRRFKRLYPALVMMLVGTTFAYFLFGFLYDTDLYLKSVFSSFFASSNLYFLYKGDNYFNQDLMNPLKHTWSLGIEEQFYLLYPLFLAFGLTVIRWFKLRISILGGVLLFISALSYGIFISHIGGELGSFYFPFARFWEIGIGCALALFSFSNNRLMSSAGFVGVLIIGSLQLFQSYIGFVPLETMLAVVATVLIIYAGMSSNGFVVRLLSRSSMVYMGKLSYSLYLWHLPVLYFAYLYIDTALLIVVVPSVSFLFAAASFHLVENPLRYSEVFNTIVVRGLKLAPIVAVISILIIVVIGQKSVREMMTVKFSEVGTALREINFIERHFNLSERIQQNYLERESPDMCSDWFGSSKVLSEITPQSKCIKIDINSKQLFYVTGDSHALHFMPAFEAIHYVRNLFFIESPRELFFVESKKADVHSFDEDKADELRDAQVKELQTLSTEFSEIYFVVSLYTTPWEKQIDRIERNLRKYIEAISPYANIIFIAPTPVFPTDPQTCVMFGKHCTVSREADRAFQRASIDMLTRLADEYPEVSLFDPYSELCPNNLCTMYDAKTDTLLYRDDDHISSEQSTLLAPVLEAWLHATFVTLP